MGDANTCTPRHPPPPISDKDSEVVQNSTPRGIYHSIQGRNGFLCMDVVINSSNSIQRKRFKSFSLMLGITAVDHQTQRLWQPGATCGVCAGEDENQEGQVWRTYPLPITSPFGIIDLRELCYQHARLGEGPEKAQGEEMKEECKFAGKAGNSPCIRGRTGHHGDVIPKWYIRNSPTARL